MTRTADDRRRTELLERAVDYVMEHGLGDFSLRPLADALGTSARILLYYFSSKEELVVEIIRSARERQRAVFEKLPRDPRSYGETLRAAWAAMSVPEHEPIFRLFFEVYGMALLDRRRFRDFLRNAIEDWLEYLAAPKIRAGYSRADARALATVMLAGFRGFLLDLCATHDRSRIGRAIEMWIEALDAIPEPAKRTTAKRPK